MNTTQNLLEAMEQWLLKIIHLRVPVIQTIDDIRNIYFGTSDTNWGHWIDTEIHIETYIYTPQPYFVSADKQFAVVVRAYLALKEKADYGKWTDHWSLEYPKWYLEGKTEPSLFEEGV